MLHWFGTITLRQTKPENLFHYAHLSQVLPLLDELKQRKSCIAISKVGQLNDTRNPGNRAGIAEEFQISK